MIKYKVEITRHYIVEAETKTRAIQFCLNHDGERYSVGWSSKADEIVIAKADKDKDT